MFPSNTHILLADDMSSARVLTSKVLRQMGFTQITQAPDGLAAYEAILKAKNEQNPVALALIDFAMPKCNGFELYEKLQSNSDLKNIPCIFLTAESSNDFVAQLAKTNASGYIIKPIEIASFTKKLESIWENLQKSFR